MNQIKKVVIPVAGKGTRLLPITKTIGKTLLPIIDTPVIQYLLEEAIKAGINEALIIIGPNQTDVIDYFNTESSYVKNLNRDYKEIRTIKKIKTKINISYAIQEEPCGLGDAILKAEDFANGNDFAVILGDDVVCSNGMKHYGISCLCELYKNNPCYYLGVEEVPFELTNKYGIVKATNYDKDYFPINGIIEKPSDNPPSNMACIGRYILKNSIFEYLKNTNMGYNNELQLTDGIALALEKEEVFASKVNGVCYDVGTKLGYIEATIAFAKTRDDLKEDFDKFLEVMANS